MIKLDEDIIRDRIEAAEEEVQNLEEVIADTRDDELVRQYKSINRNPIVIDMLAKRLNWLTRLFTREEMACTFCNHYVKDNADLHNACKDCAGFCDDCEKHDECVCRVCKNGKHFEIDWDGIEEFFEEVDHGKDG